ncbi:hypothetical protein EVAR_24802_1 [Eumeta japonica]|uniref:Uncharacterized protein n=1 Tax=Eumeta variegata TaxID=151549 RepID=A0A4C1W481_EUMVA|nr:hypothetical protein EVAR_24802_1 [Eumeta japonica]
MLVLSCDGQFRRSLKISAKREARNLIENRRPEPGSVGGEDVLSRSNSAHQQVEGLGRYVLSSGAVRFESCLRSSPPIRRQHPTLGELSEDSYPVSSGQKGALSNTTPPARLNWVISQLSLQTENGINDVSDTNLFMKNNFT